VEGRRRAPSLSLQTELSCLLGSSSLEGESSHLLSSSELTQLCHKSQMSRVILRTRPLPWYSHGIRASECEDPGEDRKAGVRNCLAGVLRFSLHTLGPVTVWPGS